MDVILWAIATHNTGEEGDGEVWLVRFLKGLKFGKLARIWRLRKLKSFASTIQTEARRRAWRVFSLAAIYLLLCHWTACGLAFIADPSISPLASIDLEFGRAYNGESWLEVMQIATVHPFQKYVRAFHFAVQTVALLGDGGITFRLPGELTYAVVATWVGMVYMLYAISSVCMLVTESSIIDNLYMREVSQIRAYAANRRIPKELERSMLELHAWRYRTTGLIEESALTGKLTGGLQQSLGLFRAIGLASRVPYFQGMDSECVRTLVLFMEIELYIGGELIAFAGDHSDGCYYICSGQLALVCQNKQAERRRQELLKASRKRMLGAVGEGEEEEEEEEEMAGTHRPENQIAEIKSEGDLLAEEALLQEWRWSHTIQALSCCELQLLSRESFLSVLDQFPHELDRCQRMAQKIWPHLAFEGAGDMRRSRAQAQPGASVPQAPPPPPVPGEEARVPVQEPSLSPRDRVQVARAGMVRGAGSFWAGNASARASSMNLGKMARSASFKAPLGSMLGPMHDTFAVTGADGRPSAQLGAFQRMVDETSAPLALEVMTLRKQVYTSFSAFRSLCVCCVQRFSEVAVTTRRPQSTVTV